MMQEKQDKSKANFRQSRILIKDYQKKKKVENKN